MLKLLTAAHDGAGTAGPVELPADLDFESLDRLCPLLPALLPLDVIPSDVVADIRSSLRQGLTPPLPEKVSSFSSVNAYALLPYITESDTGGQLYVLEFQGCFQYVMYGQTTDVRKRVATHRREAERHGFGLVNGWVSPPLENPRMQEKFALDLAGYHHGAPHDGERFYEMPYDKALTIARVAAENGVIAEVA
ncbi:hypothetical protein ACFO9E_22710 [Streptomyces maoxianensis]|uniref:GIY-YIG nuclease family protein n=1 Tax=Streptomyces maoxianensis TaxID=1459942 RepID=A0ABV9GBR5_9ACTN